MKKLFFLFLLLAIPGYGGDDCVTFIPAEFRLTTDMAMKGVDGRFVFSHPIQAPNAKKLIGFPYGPLTYEENGRITYDSLSVLAKQMAFEVLKEQIGEQIFFSEVVRTEIVEKVKQLDPVWRMTNEIRYDVAENFYLFDWTLVFAAFVGLAIKRLLCWVVYLYRYGCLLAKIEEEKT